MIGEIYPKNRRDLFWSELFFIFNLGVLFFANISLITDRRFIRPIGVYGLAVAVINVLFLMFGSTPLLEWFTVFTALGYVALLAYNTHKISLLTKSFRVVPGTNHPHSMFRRREYDNQPRLAPKTSDAQETKHKTKNQMAPSPSKKLRMQADSSKHKSSDQGEETS